ncbi:MAG: hypothetical protein FJY86_02340 [Candidatus Diapherotrites archaeon]|uniref:Uncharacterized protein n=1 Tax=Candidatus Iainarchaeum sp. TaxID=3101447 RepID=A0A8T4C6K4_9ARCH|nr:hypothetical protein [Candidatus Diapherotrites archaeon]
MVLRLSTRTPIEYESNLTRFILNESVHANEGILFLDCQSTLTRYLRSRRELIPLFNTLNMHHLQSMDELLTLLQSVDFHQLIQRSRIIIVSPFYHFLGDASAWKQKKLLLKAENAFEKIEEKFNVHVVVAEEG